MRISSRWQSPSPPHPKQKRGNKQKNAHLNFEIQFLKQTPGIRWRTEITTILLLYNLIWEQPSIRKRKRVNLYFCTSSLVFRTYCLGKHWHTIVIFLIVRTIYDIHVHLVWFRDPIYDMYRSLVSDLVFVFYLTQMKNFYLDIHGQWPNKKGHQLKRLWGTRELT